MLEPTEIPDRLQTIPKPPVQLFVRGTPLEQLLDKPFVAIVGSRKVSNYGKEVTWQLATDLARRGVVIISGLALGIDGLAHRAAVEAGGQTVAVMACGIETVYPGSHRALAERIVKTGGSLISEHPGSQRAYKVSFLERNRLIAGLSDAVIIPEATDRSGSLNTARHASEQGRPVFAVPGAITSPLSTGTNLLIQTGRAGLITSANQVLAALGIDTQTIHQTIQGSNPGEQQIIDFLLKGISDGFELLQRTSMTAPIFSSHLTMLELQGIIRPLGNNQWTLV